VRRDTALQHFYNVCHPLSARFIIEEMSSNASQYNHFTSNHHHQHHSTFNTQHASLANKCIIPKEQRQQCKLWRNIYSFIFQHLHRLLLIIHYLLYIVFISIGEICRNRSRIVCKRNRCYRRRPKEHSSIIEIIVSPFGFIGDQSRRAKYLYTCTLVGMKM